MNIRESLRVVLIWLGAGTIAAVINNAFASTLLCKPAGTLKLAWLMIGLVDDLLYIWRFLLWV